MLFIAIAISKVLFGWLWLHGNQFGSGRYKQAGINKIDKLSVGQWPMSVSKYILFYSYQRDQNLANKIAHHGTLAYLLTLFIQ